MFRMLCREELDGVRVYHMLDESLLQNTIEAGKLEPATVRRVARYAEGAGEAGADALLVTCSSIGAAVPVAQAYSGLPVYRIDRPMAEEALRIGSRIGVAATLRSTLEPTGDLLRQVAAEADRPIELMTCLVEGAFAAVSAGDAGRHDAMVRSALTGLAEGVDVIVLAQASMARVAASVDVPVPVLSSPRLAVRKMREILVGPERTQDRNL